MGDRSQKLQVAQRGAETQNLREWEPQSRSVDDDNQYVSEVLNDGEMKAAYSFYLDIWAVVVGYLGRWW